MPDRSVKPQFVVTGGLDTEQPGGILVDPTSIIVDIPYLVQANNVLFEGTSVRKVGGAIQASAPNNTADETAGITNRSLLLTYGQSDYTGTELSEVVEIRSDGRLEFYYVNAITGKRPSSQSGDILNRSPFVIPIADGTTPAELEGRITNTDWTTTAFEDYLVIASTNTTIGPQLFVGPSHSASAPFTQPVSGSPHFSFSEVYQNRLWVAGDPNKPSRLYYSDLNDPTTGYAANFLDIDPFGSNKITALKVYRNRLFIFKGPEIGAIYTLSGSTPSTFALDPFSRDIGCVGPNAVVEFSDDVMFMDTTGHLRTIATTDKFGDFESAIITQGIRTLVDSVTYRPNITSANMTNDTINSRIWVQVPTGVELDDRLSIVVDYSQRLRISTCDWVKCSHVVHFSTANYDGANLQKTGYLLGISGKHLWELDVVGQEYIESWTIPASEVVWSTEAYKGYFETPNVKFAPTFGFNNISQVCISTDSVEKLPTTGAQPFDPTTNLTFKWFRDNNEFESTTLSQTFGSRLGTFTYDGSEFVLGASRLGGPRTVETYAELETSDFRRISFAFEQSGEGEGLHVHSFSTVIGIDDSRSTENLI